MKINPNLLKIYPKTMAEKMLLIESNSIEIKELFKKHPYPGEVRQSIGIEGSIYTFDGYGDLLDANLEDEIPPIIEEASVDQLILNELYKINANLEEMRRILERQKI